MFNQVTESARKFAREFDNEDFRLVRSLPSFEKFASADGIELKSTRGKKEGIFKKRYAFWSDKAGHGVIGDKKDVEKFFKLCDEVEEKKEPAKRGRKPKEENAKTKTVKSSEPAKRGRKPKSAVAELPVKKRGPKAIKETEKSINEVEPDLQLDIDKEYPERHNRKELIAICKSEFKRLGIDASPEEVIRAFSMSQNIRDIFEIAVDVYS